MSLNAESVDIKLEAVNATWGRRHCRQLGAVANTANVLAGKYLPLNYTDASYAEVQGYLWFDDGVASDPAPAGLTLIGAVSVTSGDDAPTVAAAMKTAIDANANFKDASVSGSDVTVENDKIGPISAESDPDSTSISNDVLSSGIGGLLGATAQGGSTLTLESQTFELKSDQTAELLLGEIFLGNAAQVEMGLIEMTKERWETIVGSVSGDIFTPSGGTRLVGVGESKLYKNAFDFSGELVLHPIRLPEADKSEDIVLWKCAPIPADINYSGTDQQVMNVTFKAYRDGSKPSEINQMAQGDHTQDLS